MSEIDMIPTILERISSLLSKNKNNNLAKIFDQLIKQHSQDEAETKRHIRNLYGGMGSFNDLILHDCNGYPLKSENIILHELREELYQLSQIS